jgi:hypothetical protein
MKKYILISFLLMSVAAMAAPKWQVTETLGIEWNVSEADLPHADHIEMTGEKMSTVLFWDIDAQGAMTLDRSLIYPLLRTIPNVTSSAFRCYSAVYVPDLLNIDGMRLKDEKVTKVTIDGTFAYESTFSLGKDYRATKKVYPGTIALKMTSFPSTTKAAYIERYTITNVTRDELVVMVPEYCQKHVALPEKGEQGSYVLETSIAGSGCRILRKGESLEFDVLFRAYPQSGCADALVPAEEQAARETFIRGDMDSNLILQTPDKTIDAMFRFAKIRASESIFKTKRGYMHAPGGTAFYAAVWCNDQGEYTAPLCPFIGYGTGNEAAMNCVDLFGTYMKPDYGDIPSSIISEGDKTWHGAGDRGDAAMLVYGAARYALASGSRAEVERLWPEIQWCLEFCNRKLTADGVVASDSDELEDRFPSGDANLCTSSLYYDALLSSAYLNDAMGGAKSLSKKYRSQAAALREAIEKYFGANVQGYDTYRYYDGNDILRSWICIPLTVGIMDRAEQTLEALFCPKLWSPQGCLTAQGSKVYWDRTTLYGLRGAYAAGATEEATEKLHFYSDLRLLGDHVPYAIEAWPEGGQAHLAGESALYCRIITEGLFGIRPTGLDSFELLPRLPEDWPSMALRHVRAFGSDFDIEVSRDGSKLHVKVSVAGKPVYDKKVSEGTTCRVRL